MRRQERILGLRLRRRWTRGGLALGPGVRQCLVDVVGHVESALWLQRDLPLGPGVRHVLQFGSQLSRPGAPVQLAVAAGR